jgi:ubiquinone/menaquinone biosynthesis C-methylase UbiE
MLLHAFGEKGGLIMPRIEPFEKYTQEYDDWFEKNRDIFYLELESIKGLIPKGKVGIELGVGTGRFAEPIGIELGIDPSINMALRARERGIQVCLAAAEELPFVDQSFDFVLMVTTICFLDNAEKAFKEINRVLKSDGVLVLGFIDKDSDLGKSYELKKKSNEFYKYATFYSVNEVMGLLRSAGFQDLTIKQTIFSDKTLKIAQIEEGYGKGSFVVIKAIKILTNSEN